MGCRTSGFGPCVLLLIGGVFVAAGCNVFEGMSPSPTTVSGLLAEGRSALAEGEASRAVRLLERAYERDSTHIGVRVELGNALYADRGIDVFTVRAVLRHLGRDSISATGARSSLDTAAREATVCTDGAQPRGGDGRYVPVPLDHESLRPLREHGATIERVRSLVVDGVLHERAVAFSDAAMRVREKGRLIGALTLLMSEIIRLQEKLTAVGGSLYRERRPSSPALVACAPTEDRLEEVRQALCQLGGAGEQAVEWLARRHALLGRGQNSVLIAPIETFIETVNGRAKCTGPTVTRL